ncbi:hypothetical protein BLNAU_10624 [Blattamonas nauphoetae]|uniref:Uncharacterized protein n=1 Tax=Blattamonas nauphoetae TaxID=2049346 RepID=A0ABQ9XPU9_9EUKA|nr:hypothetical protein BLNAU_10624 [Blattamonas nauphoetae]
MYYRNLKQSEEPEQPFFTILAPPVPAPQEASQPENQENSQQVPASPPVKKCKHKSKRWQRKIRKTHYERKNANQLCTVVSAAGSAARHTKGSVPKRRASLTRRMKKRSETEIAEDIIKKKDAKRQQKA